MIKGGRRDDMNNGSILRGSTGEEKSRGIDNIGLYLF